MKKIAVALALAGTLAGCVVVWGRGYEVEAETSEWITIKYDTHFASLDEVQQVAEASCGTHGKRAIMRGQDKSIWQLTTADFDCVPK